MDACVPITRAPDERRTPAGMLACGELLKMSPNILTVDLEEWFHIDERLIPPGEWDRLPSRVEANARALLDLLDAHAPRATFFAVGWVAARRQRLVGEIHERGPEGALHGYRPHWG